MRDLVSRSVIRSSRCDDGCHQGGDFRTWGCHLKIDGPRHPPASSSLATRCGPARGGLYSKRAASMADFPTADESSRQPCGAAPRQPQRAGTRPGRRLRATHQRRRAPGPGRDHLRRARLPLPESRRRRVWPSPVQVHKGQVHKGKKGGGATRHVCYRCGKAGAKCRACGQCHRAWYCGRECQRAD